MTCDAFLVRLRHSFLNFGDISFLPIPGIFGLIASVTLFWVALAPPVLAWQVVLTVLFFLAFIAVVVLCIFLAVKRSARTDYAMILLNITSIGVNSFFLILLNIGDSSNVGPFGAFVDKIIIIVSIGIALMLLAIVATLTTAHAPVAHASRSRRLTIRQLETGGRHIVVPDTGLLTTTQLSAVRRFISGNADIVADGQPQERVNAPSVPKRQATPARVRKGANAPAKRRRTPKDPNAPKRASNAYFVFLKDYRARAAGTGLKQKEITRRASNEWNQLSGEDRLPFLERAREDKERYAAERAQYALNARLRAWNPPANGGD